METIKLDAPWKIRRTVRLKMVAPVDLLDTLPGVLGFEPLAAGRWAVTYDVRIVQFATIAAALEAAQPAGWGWRWLIGWRQFQDVNNRDSLLAQGGACCNRPPRKP